ncbi:hypothetical protein TI01_0560 [Lysobacter sp. A03]|nr:hypothetical protein TI01_0560 [Lysobacter sp. A03]
MRCVHENPALKQCAMVRPAPFGFALRLPDAETKGCSARRRRQESRHD